MQYSRARSIFRSQILSRSLSGTKNSGTVSAALVKELRQLSNAPLLDCKAALLAEETQGDMNKALEFLRKKGIIKVSAANRATNEGIIAVCKKVNSNPRNHSVTLLEVNCETDFVTLNNDFQKFARFAVQTIQDNHQTQGDVSVTDLLQFSPKNDHEFSGKYKNIEQALQDMIATIRENIVIKRAVTLKEIDSPSKISVLSYYLHNKIGNELSTESSVTTLGKAANVLELSLASNGQATDLHRFYAELNESIGKKTAMHIHASKPLFLSASDVPAAFKEQELAILRDQTVEDNNQSAKKKVLTEEMLAKIVANKLNKRCSDLSLLSQVHMVSPYPTPNMTVQQVLDQWKKNNQGLQLSIDRFLSWSLSK